MGARGVRRGGRAGATKGGRGRKMRRVENLGHGAEEGKGTSQAMGVDNVEHGAEEGRGITSQAMLRIRSERRN